ncbi:501_t:CDS:2 [Ambispora gerdemannii]|uniref:DnaJ homolog 1, mitochondrial n=1 Tax=Ambispora gerdemannii TaxID=144530 RepID=A0A9N9BCX0_9GLOM|nr:501_t:CDS:2 [Ambispora gerdemannii]
MQVLSDEEKRAQYDQYGHEFSEQPTGAGGFTSSQDMGGFNFAQGGAGGFTSGFANTDLFDRLFGSFGGPRAGGFSAGYGQAFTPGEIFETFVDISFMDAIKGTKKKVIIEPITFCKSCKGLGTKSGKKPERCPVCSGSGMQHVSLSSGFHAQTICNSCRGKGTKISSGNRCPTCGGAGRVIERKTVDIDIPAGIEHGMRIRVPKQGNVHRDYDGPPGDLHVVVNVAPSPLFERKNQDIYYNASIPFYTALLGGFIRIPTVDGDVELRVPPGAQPEQQTRLKSRGAPKLTSTERGDQIITFKVKLPKILTPKQRELIEKFATLAEGHNSKKDREHAEEYLDFWLDIAEHEMLCKHFMRDLRRTGIDVNLEYPEFVQYKSTKEKNPLHSNSSTEGVGSVKRNLSASSRGSDTSLTSGASSRAPSPITNLGVPNYAIDIPPPGGNADRNPRYRDSVRSNTTGNLSFVGQRPITRDDIKFSADRIYYRYVVAQSEKEINLSEPIRERMRIAIEKNHRDDPNVFQEAKDEVMELMRLDPFPRFLQARAYGNMTVLQTIIRLGLGLFCLFVGFSVELSLIFLDEKRLLRLWGFIPIFFGVSNLFANQTELSPLFVLLKTSETTFLKFQIIRELYIYKLQIRKGIRVFLGSLLVSLFVTGFFIALPGHRL